MFVIWLLAILKRRNKGSQPILKLLKDLDISIVDKYQAEFTYHSSLLAILYLYSNGFAGKFNVF